MQIETLPTRIVAWDLIEINAPEVPNHRKLFDDKSVNELAENVVTNGLINPPVVWEKPEGEHLRLILLSGERRMRAIKILIDRGAIDQNIPIKVFHGELIDADFLSFADNIVRKDVTAYEKAAKLAVYQDKYGMKAKDIADKLQCNPTWIHLALKAWNSASDELKEAWKNGLPSATVYKLAEVKKEDQPKQTKEILKLRAEGGKKAAGVAHRAASNASGGSTRATGAELKTVLVNLEALQKKRGQLSEYHKGVRSGIIFAQGGIGIAEFEEDLYNVN